VKGGRPTKEQSVAKAEVEKPLRKDLSKGLSETKLNPVPITPKEDVQKRNANLASEQAAKMVGANRTYVQAATKAAGYDAKTQTFAKPEVLASIGKVQVEERGRYETQFRRVSSNGEESK
jgi:hypothetical protein